MPKTPPQPVPNTASIKLPDWLPELGKKEEGRRLAAGLIPKKDGWYKTKFGKTRYVCKSCPVAAAEAALAIKLREWEERIAPARPVSAVLTTVETAVELYLSNLLDRVEGRVGGKFARRTYDDVIRTLDIFAEHVGDNTLVADLGPSQFGSFLTSPRLKGKARTTLNRHIIYVKAWLNWCAAVELRPIVNFGPSFRTVQPSEWADLREETVADDTKFYDPAAIKAAFLLVEKHPLLHAAGHLGLNCAFIPQDLATLTISRVDLDAAAITRFRRGKTGIPRVCPLVPETVAAIRQWLEVRHTPANEAHADLLFLTGTGRPLSQHLGGPALDASGTTRNYVSQLWGQRTGHPFTGLRTTFATHADAWGDQLAVDVVMGHSSGKEMKTTRRKNYVKRLPVERVRPLVEHVWQLAFGRVPPAHPPVAPSPSDTASPPEPS